MKKIWKLSVCTLAAAFTLSAVTACGGEEDGAVSYITAEQAYSIGEEVVESLEGTKSFEFGFSASASETMPDMTSSNSMEVKGTLNFGEEHIDGKFSSSTKSTMSIPGMPALGESESSSTTIYMIDGYQYIPAPYDDDGKTYVKMETTDIEDMIAEIEADSV
ncbi:MAG: hypothetical protein E7352_07170 [Clostridiales bacterium]|nr:hypothetical protein [Clostridiales bacterium]